MWITATVPIMMTTVPKIKLGRIPTLYTCLYILISMLIGFSTFKATMILNPIKEMSCPILEATDSTLLRKSSIPSLESYLKVNNIEKHSVREAKNHTDLSWTVKWDSLKSGITNNLPWTNKKSRIFWKLSIGKSLAVDSLNMIKVVLIMMISFKISKLGWFSWKTNSIIHQKQQFLPIHLDIHKLHWQFWLIWVLKDSLLNVLTNIFYSRTKHNSFGKLNPPMVNIMELYQLISDGPFMVSKINSLVQDQDKIYVQQKKTTSTIWGDKTSF